MPFSDTRVLIATALDTVTGVTGHSYRPASIASGSAWPQLVAITRGPGDAFMTTWQITVVLGADERAAANFIDDLWPELVDELEDLHGIVYVNEAAPAPMPIQGQNMHVLQVMVTAD
jgi:hypothetical protein